MDHQNNNLSKQEPEEKGMTRVDDTYYDDSGLPISGRADYALSGWDSKKPMFVTNIADDDPKRDAIVVAALSNTTKTIRDAVNLELSVIGFVAHLAEVTQEDTGEVVKRQRVVLLCENGETVSAMSGPVIKVVQYFAQSRGKGRWNPPVKVRAKNNAMESGRSYVSLELIDSGKQQEAEKKVAKKVG